MTTLTWVIVGIVAIIVVIAGAIAALRKAGKATPSASASDAVRSSTPRSQYVSKIINEVVGQFPPIDPAIFTSTPQLSSFREAHEHLSDEQIIEKVQFLFDFRWCFLAVYLDYFNGKLKFPVKEVVRGIIRELIKSHYPTNYVMILRDTWCKLFISYYAFKFKKILKKGFDSSVLENSSEDPVTHFAFLYAHQLVNLISMRLEKLEKRDEFIPLQLDLNREAGESLQLDLNREARESLGNNVSEEEDIPDYLVILRNASINRRKNMKRGLECSIVILIVILLTAYLSTASLNPLAIYATNNLLVKIFVSILVGLLILILVGLPISQFGQMLSKYMMRKSVEVGTGRSADSAICPSCGISVLLNNDTLGLPIVCHTCHVAWHDGPKCYRKGMPPSNAFLPSYPCPNCRSSTPSD